MRLPLLAAKALRTYFDEVHHWAFTKDLSDAQSASAAVRNLTIKVGAVVGGKSALLLEGQGYVQLPNITLGDAWSYSAWVNVTNFNDHIHLLSSQPNNSPQRFIKIAGKNAPTQGFPYLVEVATGETIRGLGKAIVPGVWTLVTVTYSKSGGLRFFLNDVLTGSSAPVLEPNPNPTWLLGSDGNEKSFAAYRNVRIWNKAISVDTIRQIQNLG